MEKIDMSLDAKKVYKIIAPASFLILYIVIVLYYNVVGKIKTSYIYVNPAVFALLIICFTLIHELIHAASFMIFGKVPKGKIKFGIILKYLTPYAYCSEVISISTYRIALLLPTIILGITPTVYGFIFKNFLFILLGDFMLVGGLGDILVVWITRGLKKGTYVLDHDKNVGCYIIKQSP